MKTNMKLKIHHRDTASNGCLSIVMFVFQRNIPTDQRTFFQIKKSRGLHGELLSCMLRCLQYLRAYLGYVVGFLMGGVLKGRGLLGNPKGWGTLENEHWGRLGESPPPPLRILLLCYAALI